MSTATTTWESLSTDQRRELRRVIACKRPRSAAVARTMQGLIAEQHSGSRTDYYATPLGFSVGAAGGCLPPPPTAGLGLEARAISRRIQGLGEQCRRCGSEHYRESDLGPDWPRECDHCGLGEGEDPPED